MFSLMASCFNCIKNRSKPARDVKFVIIGLDDAGKSTTLASLQGEPPDGITPTIGFANATLTFGKWNVTLYDLGGGTAVRSVWQKYFAEVYGIVFTVDSSNEERICESRDALADIFDSKEVHGKPVVIFANKQDKRGALNETAVAEELELEDLAKAHNFSYQVAKVKSITKRIFKHEVSVTFIKHMQEGKYDSELWKQYQSVSQKMMGQMYDLETVEPQEVPISTSKSLKSMKPNGNISMKWKFPCSAIKGYGKNIDKSIRTGIEWLLKAVEENYEKLHTKVEKESAVQQEKEAKERKERMERIRKLREEREKAAKEAGVEESENEDDGDVVGGHNPFRKIEDQIVVTEKREKKEKEKMKKIKAHQTKKDNADVEEVKNVMENVGRSKKKPKTKTKNKDFSSEMPEVNPRITVEEPTPDHFDESMDSDIAPKKRLTRKKKNDIGEDELDSCDTESERERYAEQENRVTDSHTVIYVDSAENLRRSQSAKSNKTGQNKKIERNVDDDDVDENESDNISSFEDMKRQNSPRERKRTVKKPTKKSEKYTSDDVNIYTSEKYTSDDVNIYTADPQIQSVTSSRAELFQAKSYDNLQEESSNSDIKRNEKVKIKKSSEQIIKKGKKKNRTLPSFKSPPPFEENSNRSLPPLNGHLSRLEPIKSRGRLPELKNELSAFPPWARAMPNSENAEVFT